MDLALGGFQDTCRFNYADVPDTYFSLHNLYSLVVGGSANNNNAFDQHAENPKIRYRNTNDSNGNPCWDVIMKYNNDETDVVGVLD